MKTEAEIRKQRESVMKIANGPDTGFETELAKNLVHTLTWILDEDQRTTPPSELFGWTRMRFTPEALEVIRFRDAAVSEPAD